MSIFTTILEKLGLRKPQPAAKPPGFGSAGAGATSKATLDKGEKDNIAPAQAAPKAISEVDVVKHLEQLGKGSGLDWKVSIVDLLKLLNIDSSREARNELAKELGCPEDLMKDSAKMNTWLHKTVLKKIAENGGNIPQSLLN
jgi:hypothetical protein